ncbi:hypothetical protein P9302_01705 [Brevibacillus agri]|uniref:hypothetical protein n=1 Tax=Brevibacillus agri TaxID=51101 RepID=UPI002E24595F|nr:hypothetical protein [Brevibacillus agri]
MNKKVTLSLLSATVFASMAASAFAAPTQGVYMGGSVDKFYKLDDLFNLSAAAKKQFVVDMNAANPDLDFKNLVFVDFDGKGAKFSEILAEGTLPKAKRDLTKADFEGSYVTVNLDGSNGASYDPRNDAIDDAPGELKVESVSAINKQGVTVSFAAIAEAQSAVTVTVKDNTGKDVAVKPVDLVKGETTATFEFVTALGVDPTGKWTVNGKEFDLDLKKNLDKVYDAANQVELLSALKALGLTNVSDDNIVFYADELTELKKTVAKADFTKEQAQKVVTDGNAKALTADQEVAIVKAVNDAKNEVQLLKALQNSAFARVNAEWIVEYKGAVDGAIATAKDSVKKIQALVDAENNTKLNVGPTSIVGKLNLGQNTASIVKDDLNKAKTTVAAYMVPDAEGVDTKAEIQRKIDVQLAVVKVLEATTPAQLTSAINALKAVDAAYELDMTQFKDANRQAYLDHFKTLTAATALNTISKINDEIIAANTAADAAPINAIKTAASDDALLKALKAYGEIKYVADDNKAFYWAPANANFSGVTTKASVQTAVDTANLAAITATTGNDAEKLYKALVNYGQLKDVNVSNKAFYWDTANGNFASVTNVATTQAAVDKANIKALQAATNASQVLAKLNVMTQLKNVKPENAAAYLADVTGASGTIKGLDGTTGKEFTVAKVQGAIDAVNTAEATKGSLKGLNEATTATEVRDSLTAIALEVSGSNLTKFKNLTASDRLLVAEIFMSEDVFGTGLLVSGSRTEEFGEYTTVANIKTDLDKIVDAVNTLVSDTNDLFHDGTDSLDPVISDVQDELDKLVLAKFADYDKLTAGKKLAVAEAFISAYPTKDGAHIKGSYKSFTAYLDAVKAAIAASN